MLIQMLSISGVRPEYHAPAGKGGMNEDLRVLSWGLSSLSPQPAFSALLTAWSGIWAKSFGCPSNGRGALCLSLEGGSQTLENGPECCTHFLCRQEPSAETLFLDRGRHDEHLAASRQWYSHPNLTPMVGQYLGSRGVQAPSSLEEGVEG